MKKIGCLVPEIFDGFTFLMQFTHFPPGKGRISCAITPIVKHLKMLSNLRDSYHFLFSTLPEKVEKRATFLESETMVTSRNVWNQRRWSLAEMFGIRDDGHQPKCCRNLIFFELFDYLLSPPRFDVRSFQKYSRFKNVNFCKF